MSITENPNFTVKDFASDQDVRWCPGCGDYSILAAVKKVLAEIGRPPHEYCFISGIGCSSRFPYYMNTYGMHTIHGRATAVATGFKIARPDMKTIVITGDGDALSIGGNHTIHALRRNVDMTVLLFNNQIYGLTKGQYSPTSPVGAKTKSTPMGSLDQPLEPLAVALAAEATFVARTVDMHPKHMGQVIARALAHKGTAFVEIFQNCNIFNDGAFAHAQDRKVRADNVVEIEHGKPMIYGKDMNKGLIRNGRHIEKVTIGENGVTEADLVIHDEQAHLGFHSHLARLHYPEMPVPLGVLRAVERPVYDELVEDQIHAAIDRKGGRGSIQKLIAGSSTWTVAESDGE